MRLKNSEARIILLYSTKDEAGAIMKAATDLSLVDKNYIWIATQSVVGDRSEAIKLPNDLPVGMLGQSLLSGSVCLLVCV